MISRIECTWLSPHPLRIPLPPPTRNISHANVQVLCLHARKTSAGRERDIAAVRRTAVTTQTPQLSDVEKNESNVSFLLLSFVQRLNERTK